MIEQAIIEAKREVSELSTALERGPGARELAIVRQRLEEAELWLMRSREIFEAAAAPAPALSDSV